MFLGEALVEDLLQELVHQKSETLIEGGVFRNPLGNAVVLSGGPRGGVEVERDGDVVATKLHVIDAGRG